MSLIAQLQHILGVDQVLVSPEAKAPFLEDWRGRYQGSAQAVVLPRSTEDVVQIVRCCQRAGVPMVPQGGNTGLCGGATPDPSGQAVVIAMTQLNRIRSVDAINFSITADAGVTLDTLKTAAESVNRLYPLTLGAGHLSTLGGTLATNAGGLQVLRYGMTRDLCLGLEVVLPDGSLWSKLSPLRKDNTGYDLKQLFIGAEGTLGLITAATMKLMPLPAARALIWLDLADAAQAIEAHALAQTVFAGAQTAAELISPVTLSLVRKHLPEAVLPVAAGDWPQGWALMMEVSAHDAEFLQALLAAWTRACAAAKRPAGSLLTAAEDQAALWAIRKGLAESQKREGLSVKHDVGLPVSLIPRFLSEAAAALESRFPGIRVVAFGHVGDGNLHFNLSFTDPARNAALIEHSQVANGIVYDVVSRLGGSIAAEHGIGQLKPAWLAQHAPAGSIALMQRIKAALDPQGLMNPGKVLDER